MTTTTAQGAWYGDEPATGLRAIRSLHELAERLEALQVDRARDLGWSWRQIAHGLDAPRHDLQRKHRRFRRDR